MSSEVPKSLYDEDTDYDEGDDEELLANERYLDEESPDGDLADEPPIDVVESAEDEDDGEEIDDDDDDNYEDDEDSGQLPSDGRGDSTVAPSHVAALVNDVQVSLAFEVGDSQISVGQLQSLSPGYTFELPTLVESPVVIKAFGQSIGRGQLMRVGDRVGVRVLEISCHGHH